MYGYGVVKLAFVEHIYGGSSVEMKGGLCMRQAENSGTVLFHIKV